MSRKTTPAAVPLPSPRVPAEPASLTSSSAGPAASQEPLSPAVVIWLDVFTDAIVAMALREVQHG